MQIGNQNAKVINNNTDSIVIENQIIEGEKAIKIKYEGAKDIKEEIKLEIEKASVENNQKDLIEKQLLMKEIIKLEEIIFESLVQSNGEIKGKTTSDMSSIYKNWQLKIESKLTLSQIEGIYAWKVYNFTKDLYEYNLKNKVNSSRAKLEEIKKLGNQGLNYMKGKFGKAIKTTACLGILLSCFPSGFSDFKAYADSVSINSNPIETNMSLETMENADLRKTIESKIQEIEKQLNLDRYKDCGLFMEDKGLLAHFVKCSNGAPFYKSISDGYEVSRADTTELGIISSPQLELVRSDLKHIRYKIDQLPDSAIKSNLMFYYEDKNKEIENRILELKNYINTTLSSEFDTKKAEEMKKFWDKWLIFLTGLLVVGVGLDIRSRIKKERYEKEVEEWRQKVRKDARK